MKLFKSFAFLGSGVLMFAAVLAVTIQPVAASPAGGTCQHKSLAVAIGPGLPADMTIRGTLCLPDVWAEGDHQVDLLVHGATYDREYWDYR